MQKPLQSLVWRNLYLGHPESVLLAMVARQHLEMWCRLSNIQRYRQQPHGPEKREYELTKCSDINCPVGRCTVCREEADIPRHVLLRCPALMERRLRRLGTICPDPPEVRGDGEVVTAMRSFQSRRLRRVSRRRETTTTADEVKLHSHWI